MNTLKSLPGHWFRFNLRALLALFVLIALGLTALKVSSAGWAAATATVTAGVLLFSLLGWIHGREGQRAYWSGFAVCGWGYLALVYIWGGTMFNAPPGNLLASNDALEFMFRKFNPLAEQMWPPQSKIFGGQNYYAPAPIAYQQPWYVSPRYQPPVANPSFSMPASYVSPAPVTTYATSPPSPPSSPPWSSMPSASTDGSDSAPNASLAPARANFAPGDANSADTPVPAPPAAPAVLPTNTAPTAMPARSDEFQMNQIYTFQELNNPEMQAVQTRARYFSVIGHCLFAILVGWLGANAASFVVARAKPVAA